ncbi:hypothetical protein GF327_03345 [Candidatus Woesearchaeota archaeon]|nr:hypothetical protein [Candidatus Woesearchaeota archaeon]
MKIYPVLCFILIIGLASCSRSSGSGGDIEEKYRTGTEGIVLRFLPELPPSSVFNTYPLTVMVDYRNAGAYTVGNGIIYLSGFDDNYIPFESQGDCSGAGSVCGFSNLEGKSIYNPEGLYSRIAEFKTNRVEVSGIDNIDTFTQRIRASVCYEYQTNAYPVVCIDPTVGKGTVTDKVCSVHPVSLSGGQGAPIAITNVEQEMAAGSGTQAQVIFKITIQNVGDGVPFITQPINNCHTELTFTNANYVHVDEVSFSNNNLNCQPQDVRLSNNKGFTICEGRGSYGTSAFETPLNIQLSYRYRNSISTEVEIVNIN